MTVLAQAAGGTRARPALWIVGLGGFLARGGILLMVLPMAPVPSTVGLATLVGPTSVTAAGLTADSVVRLIVAIVAAVAWLLAGTALGAVADIALVDGFGPSVDGATRRRIGRLIAIRLAALVPLAVIVTIAARSVGELVYNELVLPRDIATPLVLRVIEGAEVQVAAIGLAWLVGETLGGLGVRLAIVDDRSVVGSLGGALVQMVRHPVATLVTTAVGLAALVVAVVPGLLLAGAAWGIVERTLAGPADPAAVIGSTCLLVAIWVGWAAIAGVLAAFRSALWTAWMVRAGAPTRSHESG